MDTEYESSRIERAKRDLYRTDDVKDAVKKAELTPTDIEVANNWQDTTIVTDRGVKKNTGIKILKALVIVAVLTAFGSGGYLLYQILDPSNKPSDKNILITFDVPVGVTPGIPADIVIKVTNQNRFALEYANLTLVYPQGSRSVSDPNKDLRDEKKILGNIGAGAVAEFHTKAIFLGEENTNKELRASLEFRFTNVNSTFKKEEVRPMHLLAAPINLTVDTLKEINSGQEITLNVNALSNTVIPLRDMLVKVEYPLGFTYEDADPKPSFGNNIWRIGVMNPASKFKVKIKGIIVGDNTQEKVFHTSIGAGQDQTDRDVNTLYANILSAVTLQRPFIGITLLMNGKSAGDATAQYGQSISGQVIWKNNLPTKIVNAQIEVNLSGVAFDRSKVHPSNDGFFRSSDNTILWDERGYIVLREVEAGAGGSVGFTLTPIPNVSGGKIITNPTIIAEVTVKGKRFSEQGVPEEINTVITEEIRITSQAQFASRVIYHGGPIVNTGPLPPKVEQETTYSVIWDIVNTSNNLKSTQVHAVIPPYVQWAGAVYPSNENIIYDPSLHQVIWTPGDIPSGTGVNTPPKEVVFQIILTPSLSQVGAAPSLLGKIRFEGVDSFTNQSVGQDATDLNTILSTDPKAVQTDYNIVP